MPPQSQPPHCRESGLPCCTPDRSGKLADRQPLKAAVAVVFWSIMPTHMRARCPKPMSPPQAKQAAQAVGGLPFDTCGFFRCMPLNV